MAIVTRMRTDPRTRAYVQRRTAEGRTLREIRRCLKRYLAREIYRHLNTAARGIRNIANYITRSLLDTSGFRPLIRSLL